LNAPLLARERVERRRLRHLPRERRDEGEKDADADEHVHSSEELAGVRFGREVAVADGGQRDHAEVERVDEAKPFDKRVEAGAAGNRDGGEQRERDELGVAPEGPDRAERAEDQERHAATPTARLLLATAAVPF
jgi:hypothetical protein